MPLKGHPREGVLEWEFPSGMRMKFAHLEHDKTVYDWQGSQIPFLGFDELTHFSEKQFWYMLSRNRSASGVPGYVRATCNPDVDSWVRKLIDWWIGSDGFPIQERSGVLRWFIRNGDEIIWSDSREELIEKYGSEQLPKSLTFIPSSIYDNKILLAKDPSYLSNLHALAKVERERLLKGNWNVRPSAGDIFQRGWFEVVDAIPGGWTRVVRFWDKAATKPNEQNKDPDYTAGAKVYEYPNGRYLLADMQRCRENPLGVEKLVKNTATQDGVRCIVVIEQEPGSAGVADVANYVKLLLGFNVQISRPTNDKLTRALPLSAQCERGNVMILRGAWNEPWFIESENFPPEKDKGHDDQVDAASGAFNHLFETPSLLDVL